MHKRKNFTPILLGALACSLVAGCTGRRGRTPAPQPVVGPDAGVTEAYAPTAPRQQGSAYLYLPGSIARQLVNFEIVKGIAVMEGDIMLGTPAQLLLRYGRPWLQGGAFNASAASGTSYLWPGGNIPYEIASSVDSSTRSDIAWAVGHVNTTELNLRPRTQADRDYVLFRDTGFDCSSYVGRVGGAQAIEVGGCGRGSIPHEILHAAGFYHEQSRNDRDEHVTINWGEISPGHEKNFRKNSSSQDVGPYDYSSIMHYSARAFSRTGRPTIVPKVAGAPIGQRSGLSQLDRAGISKLYGGGGVTPPSPKPGPNPQPGPTPRTGFAGNYTSQRGDVSCTETQGSVRCQFPGGGMICAVNGANLDCAWTGGGQGRARFTRQSNGVLKGTYGDLFSNTNRGAWDLVPTGGPTTPPPTPPPAPAPGPQPPPQPGVQGSLSGNFTSSRGPMVCDEKGGGVACTFNENGTSGRLDCLHEPSGLKLTCTWATFLPRPGSGRAILTRQNKSDRQLTGTWGYFTATSGGGTWSMSPQ